MTDLGKDKPRQNINSSSTGSTRGSTISLVRRFDTGFWTGKDEFYAMTSSLCCLIFHEVESTFTTEQLAMWFEIE